MTLLLVIYSLAANAPTSLTASIIDSTSINVSWTAPVGGANGYIVVYNDNAQQLEVSSTHTILSGLSPTVYSITVHGYKDVPSVGSNTISILLNGMSSSMHYCYNNLFHLVPVQVSDVSVNTVTSTSMTVTWTPPNANTYSVITQYNISYVTSCSGQTISSSTTVTHPTTSVTLIDLEEGLNYTITVTAVNVLGESTAMLIVQDITPIRMY